MELQPKPKKPGITIKQTAKYALLPGVFPRLSRLGQAFGNILFIFTQMFGQIGLIEKDHPCLRPENANQYRFPDILGYAMRNLSFTREGIPQVLMFFAVIAAIVLMVAVIGLTFVQVAFPLGEAHAQYFGTPTGGGGVVYGGEQLDWVFRFLNRVFGGQLFTGSDNASTNPGGNGTGGTGFSALLSHMLRAYSLALLVIAAFMVLYILIVTAVESAKTGQPFGSRFDGAWAPIRLALGIGLLIPISAQGYNGAQMVAFQVAQWGSNLATNVWFSAIENAGKNAQLFEGPQPDPGYKFVHDYFMIHLCKAALTKIDELGNIPADATNDFVTPSSTNKYKEFSIGIRDGDDDFCGTIRVPNSAKYMDAMQYDSQISVAGGFPATILKAYEEIPYALNGPMGAVAMQAASTDLDEKDLNLGDIITPVVVKEWVDIYWSKLGGQANPGGYPRFYRDPACTPGNPSCATGTWYNSYTPINTWFMNSLAQDARFGWATAGVFYLRLSKTQEVMKQVVSEAPVVTKVFTTILDDPKQMGAIAAMAAAGPLIPGAGVGALLYLAIAMPTKSEIKLRHLLLKGSEEVRDATSVMPGPLVPAANSTASNTLRMQVGGSETWKNAMAGQKDADELKDVKPEGFLGYISETVLERIKISNRELNPMSTVVTYGSNLMGTAMWAFGAATAFSYFSPAGGQIAVTLGELLLISGFALAVVVPFMPFLYFMFAVIEWVISILEAVIGMPLFALSFISLEGDVLGNAKNGVMMLFEIMLRPVIIIMSLIASMLVFMAAVAFVNDAFQLYRTGQVELTSLTSGAFTNGVTSIAQVVIYVFLMYILANSSFKLIDAIPNNFMRWIGGPSGFGSMTKFGAVDEVAKIAGGAYLFGQVKGLSGGGKPWVRPRSKPQDVNIVGGNTGGGQTNNYYVANAPGGGRGGGGGGAGGGNVGGGGAAGGGGGAGFNPGNAIGGGGGGGPAALLGGQSTGGAGRGGGGGGRSTGGSGSKFDKGQGDYVDFEDVPPKK